MKLKAFPRHAHFGTFLLPFLLFACSASLHRQGLTHLEKKEFNEAIALLEQAERQHPQDAKIKRDLGVALHRARRFEDAVVKLREAQKLDPKDSKTVFYLGLTYERLGRLAEAIQEYKQYKRLSRSGGFRKEISKRIRQLTNEQIAADIAKALAAESRLDARTFPKNTVAVLYFKNLGGNAELDPLQKGLAQVLITDLAKVRALQVVERLRLQKLLEELKFAQTVWVEPASAPRVGKLLGARKLIAGGFTKLGKDDLRIDAALTETATSATETVTEVTGKMRQFFSLEKKLCFEVLDELGITLTPEERDAIQKIPTESLLAFLAYSRGLDFEDRGLFDQARQQYQKALAIDPNFEAAKTSLDQVEVAESATTTPKTEVAELQDAYEETESEVETSLTESRLLVTGAAAQTGQTPLGDTDTRKPVQEATGSDRVNSTAATVPLRIPLPDDQ